ncbi:hypothetical protein PIB30_051608 [Stylosanthes scabra]|uniref:Uncharacterized protein n=1 Tax=Stylosanthes scabra TaxID=79078 RepID=A0ABU6QIK0_9FABA|nr:hypothetical protein [Stylosanthes scabra]
MVDVQHNNEDNEEVSMPLNTPVKGMIPTNQTLQELEDALKGLLDRQIQEAAIAAEARKRAEEMANKQQALLEETEKREKEWQERFHNRPPATDEDTSRTADSQVHTWKPSVVIGNQPLKENNKHPFTSAILAEELPKKFKYPVDMEPYDGRSDPKHHLDVFDNMMVLLNASNVPPGRYPLPKSLTKRPPKTMEEIQEISHEYLQQEEGQTTVKTDRDKRESSRKDPPRENCSRREHRSSRSYYNPLNVSLATFLHEVSQVEIIPAPRAIKNTHRGDRNAYCKYHKQNGHDTEDSETSSSLLSGD